MFHSSSIWGRIPQCHSREGGEGKEGEGTELFVLERDKGQPLDREETDVDHRKMAVYKGKGERQC